VVADRLFRTAEPESFDRFCWVHVLRLHEPARLISSYWKQSQSKPWVRPSHITEGAAIAETCIADKVDAAARLIDHKRRPQGVPSVFNPARRPVVRAAKLNDNAIIQAKTVPPVADLDHDRRIGRADDGVVAKRCDDPRLIASPKSRKRGDIHVVIVVVADQHCVDGRQVVKGDAGRGVSRRSSKIKS